MTYYAYMLKSETSGRHYYGHTSDLDERIHEHNTDQSPHTKGKGPWILIGFIECKSRSEAMKTESKLKEMKSPARAYWWLKRHGVVR